MIVVGNCCVLFVGLQSIPDGTLTDLEKPGMDEEPTPVREE